MILKLLSKSAASSFVLSPGSKVKHKMYKLEAVHPSTPPWGKLVLKLSPLSCSVAKLVILCSSCLSAKQSCAMEAQGSKLDSSREGKVPLQSEKLTRLLNTALISKLKLIKLLTSVRSASCCCSFFSSRLKLLPLCCGQAASATLCVGKLWLKATKLLCKLKLEVQRDVALTALQAEQAAIDSACRFLI